MTTDNAYQKYEIKLVMRFHAYRAKHHPDDSLFDPEYQDAASPVVFTQDQAQLNVLAKENTTSDQLLATCPPIKLHRWFGSMKSSQALAVSVFANLDLYGKLGVLASLTDEDGMQLFPSSTSGCRLEHKVDYLGERTRGETNVDVFFDGDYRVAVECKFTEREIGSCSRPRIDPSSSNFARDYCNGSYSFQAGRKSRCSLSCQGIEYWRHIPMLFNWECDKDNTPCPVRETYQLVRNILAACVRADRDLDPSGGHAVLLYDERNPEFQADGAAMAAWLNTKDGLKDRSLLRKCTWQQLVSALRQDESLNWLTEALNEKYGF